MSIGQRLQQNRPCQETWLVKELNNPIDGYFFCGRYRSTNTLGVTTEIPLYPDIFRRALSPLQINFDRPARAQAINLSSSGSEHTRSSKGGGCTRMAWEIRSSRNGERSTAVYFSDSSTPTRRYSSRISSETTISTWPTLQDYGISKGDPAKNTPEIKTLVSRMSLMKRF